MQEFVHEKLDVYKAALAFLQIVDDILEEVPRGRGHLGDQLDRAATSIVLNVAEGAGEFAPAEKARFYRVARRSVNECAAVLDVYRARQVVDEMKIPPVARSSCESWRCSHAWCSNASAMHQPDSGSDSDSDSDSSVQLMLTVRTTPDPRGAPSPSNRRRPRWRGSCVGARA